jgi:hypothetical protein
MIDYWCMVDAILGGAPTMREAGVKYLPRFQNEKPTTDADGRAYDPYEHRRRHAPFTNIYADNSRNLASKPFAKELTLKEKTPDQYLTLAENIDGQGNSFHVVGADVFKRGLDKGIDWILVDYTKVPAGATLAAERQMGARPYWVHVPAERLLGVYSDFVNGQEIIYHARIEENATVLDGFEEACVERVRVLDRQRLVDADGNTIGFSAATWSIWEATTEKVNGTDQKVWAIKATGPITIGIIPLVAFVPGDRHGSSWVVEPPLRDVAFLQIEDAIRC